MFRSGRIAPHAALWVTTVGLAGGLFAGCGPELACVEVDAGCAPLYPPTFENIYANTLEAKCGSARVACHSAEGRAGGLSFASRDIAYTELLLAGQARVLPGDPSCSIAVERMASDERSLQMPPGAPLGDAERCAIERWIANGAPAPTPAAAPEAP